MSFNPTTDPIWQIQVTCPQHMVGPGQPVSCHIAVQNLTDRLIGFTEALIEVPWGSTFPDPTVNPKVVKPGETQYLAAFSITMPEKPAGWVEFGFQLNTWMFDPAGNTPTQLGMMRTQGNPLRVWLSPTPRYRVFLSKSNHPADYFVVNTVKEILNAYGFDCYTLGDNVPVTRETLLPALHQEIGRADATIALASPRDISAISGQAIALQWFYDEVAVSNTLSKPVIMVYDESVKLVGLAETLPCPKIPFSLAKLEPVVLALNQWLPALRDFLCTMREQNVQQWQQRIYAEAYKQGLLAGQSQHGTPR